MNIDKANILTSLNVEGAISGTSFVKINGTSDDVLLGDGSTTSLAGIGGGGGTVTSVTAGNGMTQTGTSTINPTLNVIGGNGIVSNADNIALTTLSANWNGGSTYTITANDFILGSDIRLKENIIPLESIGLDIQYVEFNYKTNKDRKRAGVIANDIESKYPELVLENEQGIKQVSYIDMLIREVVALKEEVRKLKNKI